MNHTEPIPTPATPEGPNAGDAKTPDSKPAPLLLLILGSVLLVIGLVWVSRTADFVRRAARVPGTILRIELVKSKSTTGHFPVFTFTDPAGTVRTHRSATGFGLSSHRPGQKVMVLCDPAAPENARIESGLGMWFEPVGLTAFSVVMVGIGAIRLWRARRAALREPPRLGSQ
jgi:hypothetical protein